MEINYNTFKKNYVVLQKIIKWAIYAKMESSGTGKNGKGICINHKKDVYV